MRQSQLFTKTRKEAPKDEVAKNAQLLIRAGFIHKEMAGVYAFLPLGLRTLNKICNIIREEMNSVGGQEVHMTVLQDKELWEKSGRWSDEVIDNWFKTKLQNGSEVGLGLTHEEPLTMILKNFVDSYRDLPICAYQIQTKFRNEIRAKSGIMRGREFLMKDMYSFSKDEEGHKEVYSQIRDAYVRIFDRMGIGRNTYITFASGGIFSKYSEEFQTLSEAGEDTIYVDEEKKIAVNDEVYNDEVLKDLGLNKDSLVEKKSIETGNIFNLGTRFSEPLGLTYKDEEGKSKPVIMGSYGLGPSRLMGTIVETLSDENGMVWPESVAPFKYHIVDLSGGDEEVKKRSDSLYEDMTQAGIEVLYDDRDVRAGEKFADSDLIGIPYRIVVSAKNTNDTLEVVRRATGDVLSMSRNELLG